MAQALKLGRISFEYYQNNLIFRSLSDKKLCNFDAFFFQFRNLAVRRGTIPAGKNIKKKPKHKRLFHFDTFSRFTLPKSVHEINALNRKNTPLCSFALTLKKFDPLSHYTIFTKRK